MPSESRQDLERLKTLAKEFDLTLKQAAKAGKKEQAALVKKAKDVIYRQFEQEKSALEAKLWPYEALLKRESLAQQYERIKEVYLQSGLINRELPRSKEPGITYKNGEYPFPSLENIIRALTKDQAKREVLKTKLEQGFVRLHITPLLPIQEIKEKLGSALIKHEEDSKLFKQKRNPNDPDEPLELDETNPVFVYEKFTDENLVYHPRLFDKDNPRGITKDQLIESSTFPGYSVILIEDMAFQPKDNEGQTIAQGTRSERKQLENNQTPDQYLETILNNPNYHAESGWTIEDWLSYFLYNLETTNQVSNDWDDHNALWLLGNYLPSSGDLPEAYWSRAAHQAIVVCRDPVDRYPLWGARPAVRI